MNVSYSASMSEITHPPLDLSETPWIQASLPRPPQTPETAYAAVKRPPAYFALWSDLRLRLAITLPSACALLGMFAGVLFAASIHRPEVETATERLPKTSTLLLAAGGDELRKYSRENRILLREGEVPELLAHAIVDTEDARFYHHGGVDPKAILRAVVVNVTTGKHSEGASTLTMQYARGLFNLSREKAWMRKIEEAFLAVELEKRFSKQQIVTMYANYVNLGHGNYGMEAGARAYFGKSVHQLSLAEAATLAGIPQRPADYSPYFKPELVLKRRDKVLRRMLAMNHITELQYQEATSSPLAVIPRTREDEALGPHFAEQTRRAVVSQYGTDTLYDRGLTVRTTLDPRIQRSAEKALREQLVQLDRRITGKPRGRSAEPGADEAHNPELEGAALVLETETGAIRAMVGGFDYAESEFNRVIQARRQVGSAFKLFVYAAALENGFTPADTIFDGPVLLPGAGNKLTYSPRNHARKYYGVTTLRRALESSLNVTAVKLLDMVGVQRVIDVARRCGIESPLPAYPSLALGAADLQPLELAAAYGAVANQGIWVEPYFIESVSAQDGRVLEEHQIQGRRAFSPQIAYLLRRMLEGVAHRGSARRLRVLPIATAGKTGTTNRSTDAWFVGFTPRYTILTWVGRDQKQPIGPGMTGSAAALPMWHRIVEHGLETGWLEPGETFAPAPSGISTAAIEPRTGLLARDGLGSSMVESFLDGTEPNRSVSDEELQRLNLPWYLQEPFYLAKEGERMPAEVEDWRTAKARWHL